MEVVALAGGVGAGKFLRGLVRVIDPAHLTVIVNIGDDATIHGLHIAPDIDSVLYALSGLHDEERGWGRMNETFRATEELRDRFQADDAWFNLGDLDLAAHLYRTSQLTAGRPLSDVTATMAARLGIGARILPVTDDAVPTRIECVDEMGTALDLHFQEYWVKRRGADVVKAIRFEGAADARPAPGVVEALAGADAVVLCPSNPAVSIAPVLAIPRVREAVAARRERTRATEVATTPASSDRANSVGKRGIGVWT
jgi:LPPG:FO 2-phospho-L-lactate transferase